MVFCPEKLMVPPNIFLSVAILVCQSYYKSLFFVYLFVCLFGNYSQTIGPKGLKFSGFDRGYPGDGKRKFSEDQFVC